MGSLFFLYTTDYRGDAESTIYLLFALANDTLIRIAYGLNYSCVKDNKCIKLSSCRSSYISKTSTKSRQ